MTLDSGSGPGSVQMLSAEVSNWYISRPNGALVPLIPVDEIPERVDLPGCPRQLHFSQLAGLEWLGEIAGPVYNASAVAQSKSQAYAQLQTADGLAGQNGGLQGIAAQPVPLVEAPPGQITETRQTSPTKKPPSLQTEQRESPQKVANKTSVPESVQVKSGAPTSSKASKAPTGPSSNGSKPKPKGPLPKNIVTPLHRPAPPSGREPDNSRKIYCTFWIRKGECDYMQPGCYYKHEMPDLATLNEIGFRCVPKWYRERQQAAARRNATARSQPQSPAQPQTQPRPTAPETPAQPAKKSTFVVQKTKPLGAIGSERKAATSTPPTDTNIIAASSRIVHPQTRKAYGLSDGMLGSKYASLNPSEPIGTSHGHDIVQGHGDDEEALIDFQVLEPRREPSNSTASTPYTSSHRSSSQSSSALESQAAHGSLAPAGTSAPVKVPVTTDTLANVQTNDSPEGSVDDAHVTEGDRSLKMSRRAKRMVRLEREAALEQARGGDDDDDAAEA